MWKAMSELKEKKDTAAVKETRKEQLLYRAKKKYGTEQLDGVTVRRQTNLASAKASRAKKNFILNELHTQLKRKSQDAQSLAVGLRRVLAWAEYLGTAKMLVEKQLQQQKALNSFLLKRNTQVLNSPVSEQASALSLEKLYLLSSDGSLANHNTSRMHDHTMLEAAEDLDDVFYMTEHDEHITPETILFANTAGAGVHSRTANAAEETRERVNRTDVSVGMSGDLGTWKTTDTDIGAHLSL